ncbi:MAG: nickel-dependent lactate racemase [Anaerolineales bacterium]
MHVDLNYGRQGLKINLPETTDVLRTHFQPGIPDEAGAIRQALQKPIASPPLASLLKPGDRVIVVHTDITRATPNDRILPVLLDELLAAGIHAPDITLLNGLGTHRRQTDAELRMMLGDQIVDRYRCLQHDCNDDSNLVSLGETYLGNSVRINRHYIESDVRIITGFIEPHFFAGFSGGPKAILPSLAGRESVFSNHGLEMIAHPQAAWGVTEGNPLWEEMREVAVGTKPTFLLNVALNTQQEITAVFAGDMLAAHTQGCAYVKQNAMVAVDAPYDIVVTTNSGYPLDQNLYQSVKGMSAASQVVRDGGAIIIATACEDGLPDHGLYAELLAEAGSPQGILEMISKPGFSVQDQWQVQVQAQIQLHADVYVYSDGLSDDQIRQALFLPCQDVEATLERLQASLGSQARICVMPEGPQLIPYLSAG